MKLSGRLLKLKSALESPVQYHLPIGEEELPLNELIGKTLNLEFSGEIECIYCSRIIKKSYSQGYCFPCSQKLARCDFCIVKPENCHYHLGTCREPEWGEANCFIPHIVYLANTSGIKVGITRETQVPYRWIDQGAIQALPILKVGSRYHAGLVEVELKNELNDRTNWRKMLVNEETIDLNATKEVVLKTTFDVDTETLKEPVVSIQYPIEHTPEKIVSLNLMKTPKVSGTLLGIKGQYLLFDVGVLNIRNLTGYKVLVSS